MDRDEIARLSAEIDRLRAGIARESAAIAAMLDAADPVLAQLRRDLQPVILPLPAPPGAEPQPS